METLGISSYLISPAFHRLSRPYGCGAIAVRSSVSTFRCSPRQHYFPPISSFRRALLSPPSALLANKEEAARFEEASRNGGNLVPLYRCIFCDHLTPVLAYRCLVREDEREAPSFLFESVEQGSQGTSVGRYSVVGAQPAMEIVAKENMVSILDHEEGRKTEKFVEDPMEVPRTIMEGWNPMLIDELPDAFCGGWVGYFSYDTVRYVEKKKLPFSCSPKDDRNLPDVHLGLYNDVIVFDHVEKKAFVIHWVHLSRHSSIEDAYQNGRKRLENLLARVHNTVVPRLTAGSVKLSTYHFGTPLNISSMTREEYKEAVVRAKEHILAGDIFQIVLSQRFQRHTFADPFEVYRALRIVNPSPYMTYLQARGSVLVASSPEILTRVKKVDDMTADLIVSQLLFLDAEDQTKDIKLFINSPGGSVTSGMGIYDAMKLCKADVSTVCLGLAASMGAFLLAAGTKGKRFCMPNARVMIHQPLGTAGGRTTDMGLRIREMMYHKVKMNKIFSRITGKPEHQIEIDTDRDNFMNPWEAKEYGLVDSVIDDGKPGLVAPIADSTPPPKTRVWDLWKIEGSKKAKKNLPSELNLSQNGYGGNEDKGREQSKEMQAPV